MDAKQRKAAMMAAQTCLKLLENEGHFTLQGQRLINPFVSMFVQGVAWQAAQDKVMLSGVVRGRSRGSYSEAEMAAMSDAHEKNARELVDANERAFTQRILNDFDPEGESDLGADLARFDKD